MTSWTDGPAAGGGTDAGGRTDVGRADRPRQRLLEAAERLFAERGIDGVSLAEVTRAAGLGNTGAVHHYFGGREELLDAIVEQHRADLDAQREHLLDEAEALGDTSLALLVRVLVEPMAAKLDDERGRAFLAIQAQRTLRPRQRRATPRPLAMRILTLLGLPGMPGPAARQLDDFGRDLAYAALAQRAMAEAEGGRDAGVGRDEFVQQLSGAIVRILTPPFAATGAAPTPRASGRATGEQPGAGR